MRRLMRTMTGQLRQEKAKRTGSPHALLCSSDSPAKAKENDAYYIELT